MTTYQDLYRAVRKELDSAFEADELFRHVCGKSARELPVIGEQPAEPGCLDELDKLCKRRVRGEPLQYLLGQWEFYSLPFKVGPGVLIPRQDTETLVDVAISLARTRLTAAPEILDLCSGSGCVAVALARNLPNARVTALEFSPLAFKYLNENVALNGANVRTVLSDLREYEHPESLDMIVSNPPYIPRWDFAALPPEVCYEPITALDGGEDGLSYFRAIARGYRNQLKRQDGLLLMEIGAGQENPVAEILREHSFGDISLHKDLTGIPRVIQASPR